jgi:hypothetical protein
VARTIFRPPCVAAMALVLGVCMVQAQPPANAGRGRGRGRGFRFPPGPPGPVPRLSDGKPDLTGIWNWDETRMVSQDTPEMLPWAEKIYQQRRATSSADDFETRCLPGGPPRSAPYHTALFSTPKLVVMYFEGNTHMYRLFYVDGSDHPKDLKLTFYGDSRAHWEGDTLVVDTIGFTDISWIDGAGHPHTKQMHLTERFHRVDYGNLDEKVTIDDPGAYTKPWSQDRLISLDPKLEMTDYVCNENNQDPGHIDAAHGKQEKELPNGVPTPAAKRPPPPPSGPTPHAADGKVDLSGVWVLSGSPNLPSDPSYQPWAKKIYDQRKADKQKGDPEKFCLPDGPVRVTRLPYQIVQRPEKILLLSQGNIHSYRRFYLDGRPHDSFVDYDPNTWDGNSIGKWDGDTLVVDTVSLNDKTWLDPTGKPHSDQLHIIERYSRPDLGHLDVQISLEDSKAFTKPYTFKRVFTLAPAWHLQEYVCQAILDGLENP